MAIAEDRRRLTTRLNVLRVAIGAAFGLLACGFWFFQVVQHAKFREMAENNHQRTLTLRAPRGVIFDRTGRLLVENRNSFNISIVREHTKDIERTIRVLSQVTGVDEKSIREIVERFRREPSYRPIVVIPDATLAQVADEATRHLFDAAPPLAAAVEAGVLQRPDGAPRFEVARQPEKREGIRPGAGHAEQGRAGPTPQRHQRGELVAPTPLAQQLRQAPRASGADEREQGQLHPQLGVDRHRQARERQGVGPGFEQVLVEADRRPVERFGHHRQDLPLQAHCGERGGCRRRDAGKVGEGAAVHLAARKPR